MGKIKVLDKSVSNKIAAGEVVERPASVVKELLENAIDAGATYIVTEIKNGGITYIRVADNGKGIEKDDVSVALLRHATSKISEEKDLDGIITLGFRGEALSSIAAVSNLEIYTKTQEEETGTYLKASDGEIEECREAGCPQGTTVIVRDLFSTTPARMKFLKKNYTEAGYIADIINRLALAHSEISFRLISDGKELLFTSGDSNLLNAIYSVYGKDLKNTMRPALFEEGGVKVEGFCASAQGARPNRQMQSFFVNGRFIKSPLLARAVEEAYKNELMGGKFPACVLLLTLLPTMVDINVHPTKLEAKFADEKSIYHAVYWAAKNALFQKEEIPAVTLKAEPMPVSQKRDVILKKAPVLQKEAPIRPKFEPKKQENLFTFKQDAAKEAITDIFKKELKEEPSVQIEIEPKKEAAPLPKAEIPTPTPAPVEIKTEIKAEAVAPETVAEQEPVKTIVPYKICGQVFDTYIIVEQGNEMLLVDQHAAHERLKYESLLKEFSQSPIRSQQLLLGVTVRLTALEESLFSECKEDLYRMGFEAESFGDRTVILRGAPEALDEESLRTLFLEVLSNLGEKRKDAKAERMQRAIYTIACKSAIRAGKKLTEPEMRVLLDAVFALPSINTCPHGRPITVSLTKGFIEKQFKRIV